MIPIDGLRSEVKIPASPEQQNQNRRNKMNDIDRVNDAISAFFSGTGQEKVQDLIKAFERCLMLGHAHYFEAELEDTKLKEEFESLTKEITALKETPPNRDVAVLLFQDLAKRLMLARRSTYSLQKPDRPWESVSAATALYDDNDQYSFAIYDALADDLQEIQSPLYQLAIEGDRENDSDNEQNDCDGACY